jgi:hypothetical protein
MADARIINRLKRHGKILQEVLHSLNQQNGKDREEESSFVRKVFVSSATLLTPGMLTT